MNLFKSLDTIFPTGASRSFGEVVDVTIAQRITVIDIDGETARDCDYPDIAAMKRKAWYVNASVNAFHMHRHLVREFVNNNVHDLSSKQLRAAKRLITLGVLTSYLNNRLVGCQYHSFVIHSVLRDDVSLDRGTLALWWTGNGGDGFGEWREICDDGTHLQLQVDRAVNQVLSRLPSFADSSGACSS